MKYDLVIFDFDGTLADTFGWFLRAVNAVADEFRFKRIEPDEVEQLRGRGARHMVRHLGIAPWKLPLIARRMRALAARDIDRLRLFDGAGAMLRRLAEHGCVLAVVSTNAADNVRRALGAENAALIDHFECGGSLFGKAALFRCVLKRTRIAPERAICIGDEIRDFEAARRVGIAFGAVSWGYTTAEALAALPPAELFTGMDQIGERLTRFEPKNTNPEERA